MKKLLMILVSTMLLFACNDDQDVTGSSTGSDAQIEIDAETLEVSASGNFEQDKNEVIVISSGAWRLAGQKTWCMPSATKGVSGDKVTFVAEENTTGAPRSITYTFFCEDKAVKLIVTQQQNDQIDLSEDRLEIGSEGAKDLRVQVVSTVGYDVRVEYDQQGEEWILPADVTRAAELSFLYYTVTANDTYAARSGRIIVTGKDSEVFRTITISQVQNDELKLDKDKYEQPQEASILRITVWSNIPYEVQIPDNATWITLQAQPSDPTEWSSQELVFNLDAAPEYRIAEIKLLAKDGSKTVPVGIQQGEAPAAFDVPDKVFRDYLLGATGKEKIKYIEAVEGGYTTTAAGVACTSLDLYQFYALGANGCKSLEGIQHFPNLVTIDCRYSCIRSLDLSQNPLVSDLSKCVTAAIEELKVSPAVTQVIFGKGKLQDWYSGSSGSRYWAQKFDVSGENIVTIDVTGNRLKTIDVSGCPSLTTLKCNQENGYALQTITLSESQRGRVTIDNTSATLIYK